MTPIELQIYIVGACAMTAAGLAGFVVAEKVARKVVALNIAGCGVFAIFLTYAARGSSDAIDPVPQAMVLTGIVVAVCSSALALSLAKQIEETEGEEL